MVRQVQYDIFLNKLTSYKTPRKHTHTHTQTNTLGSQDHTSTNILSLAFSLIFAQKQPSFTEVFKQFPPARTAIRWMLPASRIDDAWSSQAHEPLWVDPRLFKWLRKCHQQINGAWTTNLQGPRAPLVIVRVHIVWQIKQGKSQNLRHKHNNWYI